MAGRIQGITVEIGGDTTKHLSALFHIVQKEVDCRSKGFIFFPDYGGCLYDLCFQRAESQSTVTGNVDQSVKADRITDPIFHEKRGIVDQVVNGDDFHICQSGIG